MTMKRSQRLLAALWFGFASLIAIIMIAQTILGHFSDPSLAWGWMVPNLLPTLSLVVGVLVSQTLQGGGERRADAFLFKLSFGISLFYLLTLLATLLMEPLYAGGAAQLFRQSQALWISPIQGLATAALGAFFVRSGPAEKSPARSPPSS